MKKIFLASLLGILLLPTVASAITYPWDRTSSGLSPSNKILDIIFGNTFQATSTSQASVFPFASTSVTSADSFCLTGDLPCRTTWPTGSAFPFTPQSWGNSTTSILSMAGFIVTGSSTLSNLGTGAVFTQNGLILSHATTSTSAAYQDVWRDANQNAFAQNFISAGTSFPTNGGSVTLTAASPRTWTFTGSSNQTMQLPSGLTLSSGASYYANNNSTGVITVTNNGGNILGVIPSGGSMVFSISDVSTANGSWDVHGRLGHSIVSGTGTLGLGSTTPAAQLAVHALSYLTNTSLFQVASSTASATTTLFSISNIGSTTMGMFGTCSGSNALTTNSSGTIVCGAVTSGGASFGQSWEIDSLGQLAPTTTIAVSIPKWLSINDQTFAYASTTNRVTILGLGAGGNAATTSSIATSLVAIGRNVLGQNQTGGLRNIGIGDSVLSANTTGDDNIAIGNGAQTAGNGTANVSIGNSTLLVNTTGGSNTLVGYLAGTQITGSSNIAFGRSALSGSSNTASFNLAIGNFSLDNTGVVNGGNIAVGFSLNRSLTSGYDNLLISSGIGGAGNITTGGGNVGIGAIINFPSATANNQLNIGGLLFGTLPATSTSFQLPITGTIGIASSTPSGLLSVHLNNGSTNLTSFLIGSSTQSATSTLFSVSNTGSTTLFQLSSSLLKTNANGTIVAAVAGTDYATPASAFNFTPTTSFGTAANSTSTLMLFTAGISASSTVRFGNAGVTHQFTWDGANGKLGIGSSTPWALLSVNPNGISGPAFAIGSTTNTLFKIDNGGQVVATDKATQYTGVLSPLRYLTIGAATTTTWTATTSLGYVPSVTAPFAGTLRNVICSASSTGAFLGITPYINQVKTTPSYFVASTTEGTITFTAANTFSRGDVISFLAGTTTTATTAISISCTFGATETAN